MLLFRTLLVIVLIVVAGYGVMEALPILSGPQLSLYTPLESATTPNGFVKVSGHIQRVAKLTLNGAPLLSNTDGSFSRVMVLPQGMSFLTITAADMFGHTVTDTRTIFVP